MQDHWPRVSRLARGLVPRRAQTRVIVPCWPILVFGGKTIRKSFDPPDQMILAHTRTVFCPGSLLKPDLQRLVLRRLGDRRSYRFGEVF